MLTIARTYLGLLVRTQGIRSLAFFALALSMSIVNGVGMLMLLPLLGLLGVPSSPDGLEGRLVAMCNRVGIPLTIETVLAAFLITICGYALLLRWANTVKSGLELSFAKSLQDRMYAAIAHANWSYFGRRRVSDFTHALTSNIDRVSTATFYFLRLISGVLVAAVYIGLASAISLKMVAVCSACVAVIGGALWRQNRVAAAAGAKVVTWSEEFYGEIADQLGGMKEAKSFGAENASIAAFCKKTSQMAEARLQFCRARENTSCVYTIMSASVLAVLLVVAVRVFQVPLTELIVLVVVFARMAPRLRDVHLCYQQILNAVPAFLSAMELQQECDAAREHIPPLSSGDRSAKQAIVLRNVSYRYGGPSGRWALRNVNLIIPANTTTAIIGKSGGGKSTLADVLLGLMMPTEGTITIDGRLLDAQQLHGWRQQIGYVSQTTFLLHDSIRANLLWARPAASDDELHQVLRMAAADEFVDKLPRGLETRVGGRGGQLSGGEAQRIALARALLRQPSILILDEATSSLDAENQQQIRSAIQQLHGRLTIIVVAHQLAAVRDADQIVVLEEGQIVEFGSFDDLAERVGGRFRSILQADDSSAAVEPGTRRVGAS